jgi:hypothetical protein
MQRHCPLGPLTENFRGVSMTLRSVFAVGALALSAFVTAGPASAATVNDFISFNNVGTYATDGDQTHGYTNTSWSGSFNITFDPTQLYLTQPITGVISGLNYSITDPFFGGAQLPLNSITNFAFDGAGTLTLSSDPNLSKDFINTIDITIGINGWAYGPAADVWYSQDGYGHTLTGSGTVLIEEIGVRGLTTPVPASLPLFATGLAGLGWLARRRRKQAA